MGKRRLLTSVAIGAIAGGMIALLDRDTRHYSKRKWEALKDQSSYCIKNPSEAVHNARIAFDRFNRTFHYQAENAINALEQVEQTLDKVVEKEPKRIEEETQS